MLSSLFYMPCELHPRKMVIVYVTFSRLNESNFDNCSQLEPKKRNAEIKNANRSAENENCNLKQKIVHYDRKLRFPNEIPSTLRVIWCFVKYLVFQSEIPVFAQFTRYLLRKSQFSFGKSGICTFVTIACHAYSGHFILPYNIRNRPTCLKGLEIYMQSVYSWHKNGMFF
jgi:hypothetical protein